MIRQVEKEAHFPNTSASSRPEPRSMMWTPVFSTKTLSGIEHMSKSRTIGRRSHEFSGVTWSSGRGWNEASLFL